MIMNRTGFAIVVGAVFSLGAAAASPTGAQAGAENSSQASVQAGQTSAEASGKASASAQNEQPNAALATGSAFNAALSSPIDSKKSKPGDVVKARTTESVKSEGKTVLPKGTQLVGHVTQASARANGESESSLGIVFDKAILKNGQEIPLNVGVQAIAWAQGSASAAGSDMDTMGSMGASAAGSGAGGRGALGGVTSTAGGAAGTVTNTAASVGGVASGTVNSAANAGGGIAGASKGAVGGLNTAGQLTSNSQGVFGLNGLNLSAAGSNATEGSVITSAGEKGHLDSGAPMLLVAQGETGSPGGGTQPAAGKPGTKAQQAITE